MLPELKVVGVQLSVQRGIKWLILEQGDTVHRIALDANDLFLGCQPVSGFSFNKVETPDGVPLMKRSEWSNATP